MFALCSFLTLTNMVTVPSSCAATRGHAPHVQAAKSTVSSGDPAAGLSERLNHIEECMLGSTHRENAMEQRLETLEKQGFGHAKQGPASERVSALEKLVTARSTTSTYLPPVAPQLDVGSAMPPVPPDRHQRLGTGPVPANSSSGAEGSSANPEIRDLLQKGMAEHAAGNDDEAAKAFREVLKKNPFDANAYYNLGAMAEKHGDLSAALGDYRTALIAHPEDLQLQAAVAQVEDQIARQQGGHFQNPLVYKDGNHTVLRGNASDFGLNSGLNGGSGYTMNPAMAPPPPNGPFYGQSTQACQPSVMNINQQQPPQRSRVAGNAAAAAGEFAANVVGGGLRGGPGGIINALHCPICRLLH